MKAKLLKKLRKNIERCPLKEVMCGWSGMYYYRMFRGKEYSSPMMSAFSYCFHEEENRVKLLKNIEHSILLECLTMRNKQ